MAINGWERMKNLETNGKIRVWQNDWRDRLYIYDKKKSTRYRNPSDEYRYIALVSPEPFPDEDREYFPIDNIGASGAEGSNKEKVIRNASEWMRNNEGY